MRLLTRLAGAIVVGIGTIFGHRATHEAHWSDPPTWIADAETDEASSGGT